MSSPFKPLLAKVKLGTQVIASGHTDAMDLEFSLDVEEHYGFGDEGKPSLVKGNKHFSGSLEKVYIDKTYAELVLAGAQVDVVLYPEGDAANKPMTTVKNAFLRVWHFTFDREDIAAESVEFIGDGLEFGTVPP